MHLQMLFGGLSLSARKTRSDAFSGATHPGAEPFRSFLPAPGESKRVAARGRANRKERSARTARFPPPAGRRNMRGESACSRPTVAVSERNQPMLPQKEWFVKKKFYKFVKKAEKEIRKEIREMREPLTPPPAQYSPESPRPRHPAPRWWRRGRRRCCQTGRRCGSRPCCPLAD